ncbi:MAG: hypothetical protein AAGE01_07450 [Pseudomonadota bacterium]
MPSAAMKPVAPDTCSRKGWKRPCAIGIAIAKNVTGADVTRLVSWINGIADATNAWSPAPKLFMHGR